MCSVCNRYLGGSRAGKLAVADAERLRFCECQFPDEITSEANITVKANRVAVRFENIGINLKCMILFTMFSMLIFYHFHDVKSKYLFYLISHTYALLFSSFQGII